MELIKEMKKHLPIPVYSSKWLCRALHTQGKNIEQDTQLEITNVFDSGEAGGIVCCIINDNDEAVLVSLTHLRTKPGHLLSNKILDYQKHRIKKISQETRL